MQDTPQIPQDWGDTQNDTTKTGEVTDATNSDIAVQLHWLSDTELQELQDSLNFEFVNHKYAETLRKTIVNPALHWTYFIDESYRWWTHYLQEMHWVEVAYNVLQKNPEAKVLFFSWLWQQMLEKHLSQRWDKHAIFQRLIAHKNFRFIENPCSPEQLNLSFEMQWENNVQQQFAAEKIITMQYIGIIKHSLEPYKVKDAYNTKDSREQSYVQHAFELTQKYFPGLDTVEKMLDFVLNVKVDIPEVMTGQRIEGVYCDVDGTLIDYVPIWSPLEWTQQLRPQVVELLKQYEAAGKKIIIRTWGDVAMKETYLRTLGITRPVVSKYDYAGATAEIVVDDTDRWAFVLQSKICAETYIDTRSMT